MASVTQGKNGNGGAPAKALAEGLGWFSLALGMGEVLAPKLLARTLGMPDSAPLLRAYGFREMASGVGILTSDDPTAWIYSRVGGDALDIATLLTGLGGDNPKRTNVAVALAAVAGVTALDVICAGALSDGEEEPERHWDYSDRTGFPRGPQEMRGAASDFEIPPDMRAPEALRPWASA